jgi:two-component system, cell cycle sensor histidine kinase and response regulator CckA
MSVLALKKQLSLRPNVVDAPETILLAEDNEEVRRMEAFALRIAGYVVLEASDGEKAMQIAQERKGPIHMLITDVLMPRMGGNTLSEKLVASRPGVKVLFVSGYAGSMDEHLDTLENGAAFIQKPFSPRAFVRRVQSMLKKKKV